MKTASSFVLSILLSLPMMAEAAEPQAKAPAPAAPAKPAAAPATPAATPAAAPAAPTAAPAATTPAPAGDPAASAPEAPTDQAAEATTPATVPEQTSTSAIPTPAAWLKDLEKKGALKSRAESVYPSTILFLEETPKEGLPVFANVDAQEFSKLGFLRTPPQKDLQFFFAINKRPNAKNKKVAKTREQWLTILLDATSADTVLFMHKKEPWELIQNKGGKPFVVLSKPGASATDAFTVHKWLIGLLGYEGVVLDRKGSHFLVGTLQNVQKADTQALIIKDSHGSFALAGATPDGAGLLQLTAHESGFGVFNLLLGDKPETIPSGTKIMIEKKKDKPGDTPPAAKKTKTTGKTKTKTKAEPAADASTESEEKAGAE